MRQRRNRAASTPRPGVPQAVHRSLSKHVPRVRNRRNPRGVEMEWDWVVVWCGVVWCGVAVRTHARKNRRTAAAAATSTATATATATHTHTFSTLPRSTSVASFSSLPFELKWSSIFGRVSLRNTSHVFHPRPIPCRTNGPDPYQLMVRMITQSYL